MTRALRSARSRLLLLAAAGLVCALGTADARAPFAPLPSTRWITAGKLKMTTTALGRTQRSRSDSTAELLFGPRPGLLDGEFLVFSPGDTPETDLDVTGTYVVNDKGKPKLKVDREAVDPGLAASLEAGLVSAGLAVTHVGIKKVRVKANPRRKAFGDEIKLKALLRVNVFIEVRRRRVPVKLRVAYEGEGLRDTTPN